MSEMTDKAIGITRQCAKMLGETAGKAVDISKGYAKRAKNEVDLRKKFYELGKICYDMYCNGTDESGRIKAKIEEIKEVESAVTDARENSGARRKCPVCGTQNSYGNDFCAKCGTHLK